MTRKTRVPFTCPSCGHATKRGLRIRGGRFVCDNCQTVSEAERYKLYVSVFVVAVIAVFFAGVLVIDQMANEGIKFASLVFGYSLVLAGVIWFLAPRYWASVLRWRAIGPTA